MLSKLFPFSLTLFILMLLPAVTVFAEENGEGGTGFTEIIFTIVGVGAIVLFIFYMLRDNAK
ncbi:hypothetical protein ACFO4L_03855 [Bacillus daqingensis]|uniref:Sporulation protein YjcZ n=1 Tax=Bacillus daqingensis TaxID=872396 RepID=A0ABV9NQM9_9BACI